MHALTELIKSDMKPALGVTEPGAIAFAVSTAKAHIKGTVKRVGLRLNSGMYKNAFTCGIPGTSEVGNYYAAALGAVAADPKKGLECLEGIGKAEEEAAGEMIKAGMISVSMSSITSRIFIEATVTGETSEAVVTIQDAHTNITKITENGTVVFEKEAKAAQESKEATPLIHQYTLAQMVEYVNTVSAQELDFIKEAYKVNYELLQEGLKSPKTTYGPYLLKKKIHKLDYVIISHFDSDHVGGILTILEELNVKQVLIPKQVEYSENYNKFLDIVKKRNIKVKIVGEGNTINIDKNTYLDILWPEEKQITDNVLNNNSLIVRLCYKNFKMLFTGDIEEIAEQKLLQKYENTEKLTADILKVAHHGSKSSSIAEFLEKVNPRIALIGVGKNNKFGHPNAGVLDRLNMLRNKNI